jgi:hypothetical protein
MSQQNRFPDIVVLLDAAGALPEDAGLAAVEAWGINLRAQIAQTNGLLGDPYRYQLLKDGITARLKPVRVVNSPAAHAKALIDNFDEAALEGEAPDVPDPDALLAKARYILEAPDQLALYREKLRELGYAGPTEPAEIVNVALHSRSMDRPLNPVAEGDSGAGKTYMAETAIAFHPEDAVHDLTAMSARALAYSEFHTQHAYVFISEGERASNTRRSKALQKVSGPG